LKNVTAAIFYVRGFNEPYTEGHIAVVRNMISALSLLGLRSHIFNFRYNCGNHISDELFPAGPERFERKFQSISREQVFHGRSKMIGLHASLVESYATLRFLPIERRIGSSGSCVTNIVNCFRYPRAIIKRLLPWPTVLHVYMRTGRNRTMLRTIGNLCDGIIVTSKTLAHYAEEIAKSGNNQVSVIYPPVDTTTYRPRDKTQARAMLQFGEDDIILLYVGGLRQSRFPEDIVLGALRSIVKETSRVTLLVVAPTNDYNTVRADQISKKSAQYGLARNVIVRVRNLSEREKAIVYNAADLFVFPSLDASTAIEPPLTVLEAMACGLPVLSNDIASVTEIIEDNVNGFVIPFRNSEEQRVTEAVLMLLRNQRRLNAVSACARRYISEKMSLGKSSLELLSVYESLAR
jgi:glycosyltransferase involved in cell wall biosynthesis